MANRKKQFWVNTKINNIAELRQRLVGSDADRHGGLAGKFKKAVTSGMYMWKEKYAPLHFKKAAFHRYGAHRAKYNLPHKASRLGRTVTVNGQTLTPPFSQKNVLQARKGFPMDDGLPLVFSGNTKRGVTRGPFRVTGTSKKLTGRWSAGGISWAGLHKARLGGRGLTYINDQEMSAIFRHIEKEFNVLNKQAGTT